MEKLKIKNKIISESELLKLLGFLAQINNLNYCLIKKPILFPKIHYGSDLDFVVENKYEFMKTVMDYFDKIDVKYNYKITKKTLSNIHLDIFDDQLLVLRLDIVFNRIELGTLKVKKNILDKIFENTKDFEFKLYNKALIIKEANLNFEILIRSIEYNKFPNKKHHKRFINLHKPHLKNNSKFFNSYFDVEFIRFLKKPYFLIVIKNFFQRLKIRIKKILFTNKFFCNLLLKRKNYQIEKTRHIDMGWSTVQVSTSITVPINDINVNIKKGEKIISSKIEDTPHYHFIKKYNNNDLDFYTLYKDYLINNFDEFDKFNIDEKVKSFIELNNIYKVQNIDFEIIVSRDKTLFFSKKSNLLDGLHRISIMKYFNVHEVKCYINNFQ